MDVKEVATVVDTTVETIRRYENLELINPPHDIVGNTIYHFKELDRLRVIVYLDSLRVPIQDIRKVLIGTKTIGKCLWQLGVFNHQTLPEILKNYYTLDIRKKAYFAYQKYNPNLYNENQLLFGDDKITVSWLYQEDSTFYELDTISYQDVKEIQINPISRAIMVKKEKNKESISFINTDEWALGCGSSKLQYLVDITIVTQDKVIMFESVNWDNIPEIVAICRQKGIPVLDLINISSIFKESNQVEVIKQFTSKYRRWARNYHLEMFRRIDYSSNTVILENWIHRIK